MGQRVSRTTIATSATSGWRTGPITWYKTPAFAKVFGKHDDDDEDAADVTTVPVTGPYDTGYSRINVGMFVTANKQWVRIMEPLIQTNYVHVASITNVYCEYTFDGFVKIGITRVDIKYTFQSAPMSPAEANVIITALTGDAIPTPMTVKKKKDEEKKEKSPLIALEMSE